MKIRSLFCPLILLLAASCASGTQNGGKEAPVRKAVYVIIDGVPADMIERLDLPNIQDIRTQLCRRHCRPL